LFETALSVSNSYKRLEWFDPSEGALMNSDVEYPAMKKAAAFVCTGSVCSTPAFSPENLKARMSR